MSNRAAIDEFLAQRRLAVVGVSRNPSDATRSVFAAFRQRGYDVIPVNPSCDEIDGLMCYASVREIDPPVTGALLLTTPGETYRAVEECAEAGICRVWMHRSDGIGSMNPAAIEYCKTHGINVIPGFSPFMFLSDTALPHRVYGWTKRLGDR